MVDLQLISSLGRSLGSEGSALLVRISVKWVWMQTCVLVHPEYVGETQLDLIHSSRAKRCYRRVSCVAAPPSGGCIRRMYVVAVSL